MSDATPTPADTTRRMDCTVCAWTGAQAVRSACPDCGAKTRPYEPARCRVRCTACPWSGARAVDRATAHACPECEAPVTRGPGKRGPARSPTVAVTVRLHADVDALLSTGKRRTADVLATLADAEARRMAAAIEARRRKKRRPAGRKASRRD